MTVESGRPAPVTTDANSRARDLDAEAEAWIAGNIELLTAAWIEHGNPFIISGDGAASDALEEGARKHWPELWSLYRQKAQISSRLSLLIGNERARRKL